MLSVLARCLSAQATLSGAVGVDETTCWWAGMEVLTAPSIGWARRLTFLLTGP
jgi:hypothetical protein